MSESSQDARVRRRACEACERARKESRRRTPMAGKKMFVLIRRDEPTTILLEGPRADRLLFLLPSLAGQKQHEKQKLTYLSLCIRLRMYNSLTNLSKTRSVSPALNPSLRRLVFLAAFTIPS